MDIDDIKQKFIDEIRKQPTDDLEARYKRSFFGGAWKKIEVEIELNRRNRENEVDRIKDELARVIEFRKEDIFHKKLAISVAVISVLTNIVQSFS